MAKYVVINSSPRKANSDKISEFIKKLLTSAEFNKSKNKSAKNRAAGVGWHNSFIKNSITNDVEIFDIKSKKVMFCQADNACKEKDECIVQDDTFDLINSLEECDGAFFVSPVYFGRLPAMAYTILDRFYSKLNNEKEIIPIDPNKKIGIILTFGKTDENYTPLGIETGQFFGILGFGDNKTVLCDGNNDPTGFTSKQDQKDNVTELVKWVIG